MGLGVLALTDWLARKLGKKDEDSPENALAANKTGKIAAITTVLACLILVPANMARENWNDHDRSGRYGARDVAVNYLESCAPNAIIFTNGDNDTFPLWYAQEVEGIRTDIKVVNMSLLNTDWYIDNMLRRKTYDAKPVPFSFDPLEYRDGTRDYVQILERTDRYLDLGSMIERFVRGREEPFFPTRNFRLPVDSAKVVDNGTVAPEDAHLIVDAVEWQMPGRGMNKNHMMALDFLAENNWERPVYFAITTGRDSYMGLEEYFQLEGMAYRLVPIRSEFTPNRIGRVNTRILYDNLMNKFQWGNMEDPSVYLDEDHRRLTVSFRNVFQRLANTLIEENKPDSAIAALDKAMKVMPEENVPYNYFTLLIAKNYYKAGAYDKGNAIMERMTDIQEEKLIYFEQFMPERSQLVRERLGESMALMQFISETALEYGQDEVADRAWDILSEHYGHLGGLRW